MSLIAQRLLFVLALMGAIASPLLGNAALGQASNQTLRPQADRVLATANLRAMTRLPGHVPAWANAANKAGPAAIDNTLHLTFVLARSADRQAAFEQMLADLQNPSSSSYHRWLTPQQIGTLYGPTQHDLTALTDWLTAKGFAVTEIAPSGLFITATAPIPVVASALDTSFATFQVDESGAAKPRLSITTAPAIPTAFVPLIASITGLSQIEIRPAHQSQPATLPSDALPRGTSGSLHYITPNDFAVLYNLNPVYLSGINGATQKIAVIGRSRVLPADITNLEAATGQASKLPNVIVPPAGTDPGMTATADQGEATLDVDRAIGTAPGAQVDLVISATPAAGNDGIYIAAQYEVQTLLDPIMTISFSACEASAGKAGVAVWDTLFSQAAAEGISVFVSSGDSGAAECQKSNAAPVGVQARGINYICASSYATCVGGTEFNDTGSPLTYWSTTNGAGRESALSYIPEGAWNEPSSTSNGVTSYFVAATGGGASVYNNAKPTWQTGIGVPADGARDVPDISLSASSHNGYLGCATYLGSDCVNNFTLFSGTSASAPGMAGIAALLNQRLGSAQGNLNPLLYRLAASAPAAFHDATPATSGVTNCDTGTASMCNNSTPSATALTGGLAGFALTTGFDQATGLGSVNVASLLTAAVTTPTITITPAASSLTVTAGATSGNTDGLTLTATNFAGSVALSCAVTYNGTGTPTYIPTCSVNPTSVVLVAGGTATSTLTIASTVPHLATPLQSTASRTPAPRKYSPALSLARISLGSLLLLAFVPNRRRAIYKLRAIRCMQALLLLCALGTLSACSGSSTPASPNPLLLSATTTTLVPALTTIPSGSADTFTATVVNSGFNTTVAPTGTVQFFQNGGGSPIATATLAGSTATSSAVTFSTAGTFPISATYSGDTNFSTSGSQGIPITVTPVGTTTGSYTVTITATGTGGVTATQPIALTIQ